MLNTQGQYSKLRFSYESDAAASFLVVQYDGKVTDYQLRMLEQNSIKNVISPEVVRKEGMASFYYNITSKISLSFLLKRQKLSREEFLRLLLHITSSVSDSSGYLLNPKSFIFNIDYMYINPETLEPALVYIPATIDQSACTTLQSFISELLMMHIEAEGFDKGNFVQRVLSVVKSEAFNMKACVALMSELMYVPEQSRGQARCELGEAKQDELSVNNYNKVRKEEIKKEKEKKTREKKNNVKNNANEGTGANISSYLVVVLVIALQFAMGIIVYMSRDFLDKVGENKTVTYAAVLMIVLAVDLLIFKRIYDAKLIKVKRIELKPEPEMQGVKPGAYVNEAKIVRSGYDTGSLVAGKGGRGVEIGSKVALSGGGDEGMGELSVDDTLRRGAMEDENRGMGENIIAAVGDEGRGMIENIVAAVGGEGRGMIENRIAAEGDEDGSVSGRVSCKTELLGKDAKGPLTLRSTGKHGSDEDIVLDKDDFVIGRLAGHVDHVINNNAVGKLHAQFICKNGVCLVKDLNSMNGTFINNTRIESNKEFELGDNDRLRLANCEFILVHG